MLMFVKIYFHADDPGSVETRNHNGDLFKSNRLLDVPGTFLGSIHHPIYRLKLHTGQGFAVKPPSHAPPARRTPTG